MLEEVELVQYMQLSSIRMFGSRLEEKRPFPWRTSHLLGERRLVPRLMLSQGPAFDTQFATSRDPYDRPPVLPPEQAEAFSETPLRRTYDDQNVYNVRASDVSESEAGPAPSVTEASPQLSPADPRVNGNLLRDMELSLIGDHVFRGKIMVR